MMKQDRMVMIQDAAVCKAWTASLSRWLLKNLNIAVPVGMLVIGQ